MPQRPSSRNKRVCSYGPLSGKGGFGVKRRGQEKGKRKKNVELVVHTLRKTKTEGLFELGERDDL